MIHATRVSALGWPGFGLAGRSVNVPFVHTRALALDQWGIP